MSEAGVGLIPPKGKEEGMLALIAGLRAELDRMTALHAEAARQVEELHNAIYSLLRMAGEPGSCADCNQPIVWLTHRERLAYDPNGRSHRKTCPLRRIK